MGKIKSIWKKNDSDGKLDTNNNKPNDGTNRIMKFAFQTPADKTKYNTYAMVKDHITNIIQHDYKNGKYLAKAIRTGQLEMYVKPNRKRSTLEDVDERAFEQETFNQDYKNDTSQYEQKIEKSLG